MESVKVGDKIASGRRYSSGTDIHTVTRITAKTGVCDSGLKFRLDDFKIIGADNFGPFSVRIPTENDLMDARIRSATTRLKSFAVTASNIESVEMLLRSNATALSRAAE